MAKQTAVEWYSQEFSKLLIALEKKRISIGEYAVTSYEIFEQAKAMEREQIVSAHEFAHCEYGGGMIMPSENEFKECAEQYFTQTYGGNNG
jgi:hypothetical protein